MSDAERYEELWREHRKLVEKYIACLEEVNALYDRLARVTPPPARKVRLSGTCKIIDFSGVGHEQ